MPDLIQIPSDRRGTC